MRRRRRGGVLRCSSVRGRVPFSGGRSSVFNFKIQTRFIGLRLITIACGGRIALSTAWKSDDRPSFDVPADVLG